MDGFLDAKVENGDFISLRIARAMRAVHIGEAAEIMLASAVDKYNSHFRKDSVLELLIHDTDGHVLHAIILGSNGKTPSCPSD